MSDFARVTTVDDLLSLDQAEMVEGHLSAERGDPEPGPNRGRSFWHGWRTRMMDLGQIEIDDDHRALVREYINRQPRSTGGKP